MLLLPLHPGDLLARDYEGDLEGDRGAVEVEHGRLDVSEKVERWL